LPSDASGGLFLPPPGPAASVVVGAVVRPKVGIDLA
jgi:hypothetical protein